MGGLNAAKEEAEGLFEMGSRATVLIVALLAAGGANARDCDAWRVFAYDLQLERQNRVSGLYDAFEPKDAFERSIKNAVYQYPLYFSDDFRQSAASKFARDVKYDCRVRYK